MVARSAEDGHQLGENLVSRKRCLNLIKTALQAHSPISHIHSMKTSCEGNLPINASHGIFHLDAAYMSSGLKRTVDRVLIYEVPSGKILNMNFQLDFQLKEVNFFGNIFS